MVKKIRQWTDAAAYSEAKHLAGPSGYRGEIRATFLTTVKMEVGSYYHMPSNIPGEWNFEILWVDDSKTFVKASSEEDFIKKVLDCGFGVYTIEIAI